MHVYSGANSITGTTFYVDSIPGGMHRLYNPNSGEHFYTEDTNEKNWLVSLGWIPFIRRSIIRFIGNWCMDCSEQFRLSCISIV